MKILAILLMTSLIACSVVIAAPPECSSRSHHSKHHWSNECCDFRIDDGVIIITHDNGDYDKVEITEDGELYINGHLIDTDDKQKEILIEYHDRLAELIDYAEEIGHDGVKIGASGAKIGVMTIANLFKLLSSNYDTDDFEAEIEAEAEQIEHEAELLEEKAEELEKMAEKLEDLHSDLKDQIEELEELHWF